MNENKGPNVFIRLATYRPSIERRSIEDFFTELVAHLFDQEPTIRQTFLLKILEKDGIAAGEIDRKPETQWISTSTSGRFDMFFKSNNFELIVENKVGAELEKGQLETYIEYARQDPQKRRVAVVSRDRQKIEGQCKANEVFLGYFFWSDFAQDWLDQKPNNPYLVKGVLEFMKDQHMGPFEPFLENEIRAARPWLSFQEKWDRLAQQIQRTLDFDDMAKSLPGFALDREKQLRIRGGVHGQGIYGYDKKSGADRSPFMYFIGLIYASLPWCLTLSDESQPECVVLIGGWNGANKVHFEETVLNLYEPLLSQGFKIVNPKDGKGVIVGRRRPLAKFLSEKNQLNSILEFFETSHKSVIESGQLPNIYRLCCPG